MKYTPRFNILKFFIFIALIALLWLAGKILPLDKDTIKNSLVRFPFILSCAIFVFSYVVVTFFIWFSKDIFRFVSALLYGPYISTLLVFISETINAFILFNTARYLGRDFVEEFLRKSGGNLDRKLAGAGFPWLLIFRTVPLVPFRFLDVFTGLTDIPFRRYLWAVILGSPLRIFWLQYALAIAGEAVFTDTRRLSQLIVDNKFLLYLSLVYLVFVVVVFFKLKKRESTCR